MMQYACAVSCPRGMAKCDESKHDEVAFQLAAADFGLNSL